MREKVFEVMASVFNVAESELSDSMVLGQTPFWDSLKHMTLVMALEDEFDVHFSNDEVSEMVSTPLVLEILASKMAA